MNSFAPSTEQLPGSGSPHNRSARGQNARQPRANFLLDRLARTYDRIAEKVIDDLEYACIAAFAAVPVGLSTGVALMTGEPYWMLMIPLCGTASYITAMQGVTMLRDKITERDDRIAEISESKLYQLCEARKDACDDLQAEVSQLQHDKAHLLCERGQLLRRLHVAEEAAAGELSCSENAKAPAAVLEFQPKGA